MAENFIEKYASYRHIPVAYMKKHGLDKNTHPKFKVGDVIEFFTGYNDDWRVRSEIIGIEGNRIYVLWDCYWADIKDDERRKIVIITDHIPNGGKMISKESEK